MTNTGHRQTLILSKWRLHYRIRDEMHRKQSNMALGGGLGAKSLGLGFLQRRLNDCLLIFGLVVVNSILGLCSPSTD